MCFLVSVIIVCVWLVGREGKRCVCLHYHRICVCDTNMHYPTCTCTYRVLVCAFQDFNIALLLHHCPSLLCSVLPNTVSAEKQLLTIGCESIFSVGSTVGAAKAIR